MLSVYLINFTKLSLSPEASCFDLSVNKAIKINSACYNEDSKDVVVSLFRLDNFGIKEIKFIISKQGESKVWSCGLSCGTCSVLEQGNFKEYFLNAEGFENPDIIELSSFDCIIDSKDIQVC